MQTPCKCFYKALGQFCAGMIVKQPRADEFPAFLFQFTSNLLLPSVHHKPALLFSLPPSPSPPLPSLHLNMPSVFQRHPRYSLLSALILLSTFLLLASQHTSSPYSFSASTSSTTDLQTRLNVAERIYQKTLMQREGLIKKFGPTPERVTPCVRSRFSFPSHSFVPFSQRRL